MRVRGGPTVADYVEEGKYNISHNEMGKLGELDDKVGPTVAIVPPRTRARPPAARPPPQALLSSDHHAPCMPGPGFDFVSTTPMVNSPADISQL